MARAPSRGWKVATISPLDIALDRDNPRIQVEASDKESDIVRKLIQYEEVEELAGKIARSGLLPGERVIVVQEQGQWVVLEGNRRICACKLLLSPHLVPPEYRKTFPDLDRIRDRDDREGRGRRGTGSQVGRAGADVAPHRVWSSQMEAGGAHASRTAAS